MVSIQAHFLWIMFRKFRPEKFAKKPLAAMGRTASAIMISIIRSGRAFSIISNLLKLTGEWILEYCLSFVGVMREIEYHFDTAFFVDYI